MPCYAIKKLAIMRTVWCNWIFCTRGCESLCQVPQPWTGKTLIWVLQTCDHSLFCVAAALPLCKRCFPCLCDNSCRLSCLLLAAFASRVFHAATVRIGQGASWAGAAAAIGVERWGSRAKKQGQSPKTLDCSGCVACGSSSPDSARLEELGGYLHRVSVCTFGPHLPQDVATSHRLDHGGLC